MRTHFVNPDQAGRGAAAACRRRPAGLSAAQGLAGRRASIRTRSRCYLRGEPIAALAGARTAEAIVPAIEPDDRYPGIDRRETADVAASRCRHCARPFSANSSRKALVPGSWPRCSFGRGAGARGGRQHARPPRPIRQRRRRRRGWLLRRRGQPGAFAVHRGWPASKHMSGSRNRGRAVGWGRDLAACVVSRPKRNLGHIGRADQGRAGVESSERATVRVVSLLTVRRSGHGRWIAHDVLAEHQSIVF